VGLLRRLFVFRASLEEEIDVLVNAVVVAASAERATFLEGCLSYQSVTLNIRDGSFG